MIIFFCFFFFSSRRRHTRFDCDWSSDVCSSDLGELLADPEDERLDPVASHRPGEEAVDREALSRALQELPDPMRTAVVLKDVYGLSCQEIAELDGTTEGAVKVRLHRARRRLKDLLLEGGPTDEV